MNWITSTENQVYKQILQLQKKKYRDQRGEYLIEGPNLIEEALRNEAELVCLVRSEENEFLIEPKKDGLPVYLMAEHLFRRAAETETPQGILAVVRKKNFSLETFFHQVSSRTNILVLDRIQDPGNLGTMLRTADAAGYQGVILMKGTTDPYSSKVARSAAGALFRLPLLTLDTPEEAMRILKENQKKVLCTSLNEGRPYYLTEMKEHIALIIGNEGNGTCQAFIQGADFLVSIPMTPSSESLNAAVSAGVLMYESVRQNSYC